jgi:hypothetical protein
MPDVRYQPSAGPSTRSAYPTSEIHYSFTLDSPLLNAVFHPRTSRVLLVTTAVNEVVVVRLTAGAEDAGGEASIIRKANDDDAESDTIEGDGPRKRRKITDGHEVLYLQPWSRDEYLQQKAVGAVDASNDRDEAEPSGSSDRIPGFTESDVMEAPGSRAESW